MAGWVKLYRDIVAKDIYLQDPLYARVFERLIIEANHSCKRIPYKGETKLIKRGERLTSIRQIAEWVGWYQRGIFKAPNPKTISSILKWMIKNNLLEIYDRGNSQETHYNIVNYCIYQSREDAQGNSQSNSQVTVSGQASKQSMDTNKNVKNEKNESLVPKNKFSDDDINVVLAMELSVYIKGNNPECGKHNLQSWAADFEKMQRIDKRTVERIREIMKFCQEDNFWKGNILSASKLRSKFDALILKSKSTTGEAKGYNQGVSAQEMLKKQIEQRQLGKGLLF